MNGKLTLSALQSAGFVSRHRRGISPSNTSVIIFLNRFFYPDHAATSQLLSDLAFALADGGREVHVITSRQRYDEPESLLPARERIRGVEVHRVWTSRFGRNWLPGRTMDYLTFYTSAAWTLFRLAHSDHVIVAKTDPPLISAVAAMVARLRGARLVNWLQDLFPEVAVASGLRVPALRCHQCGPGYPDGGLSAPAGGVRGADHGHP